jgi:hypothetical protein
LLAAGRYNGSLSLYDATTYKESRSVMLFDAPQPTGIAKTLEGASR